MSASATPTSAPTGAETGWAYRPHLDGIRSVAVYLVVLFHAGVGRLSGGFIGVDVFFVLSGYLVTSLLVRNLRRDRSVDLKRFYAGRFRRLLPASAVVLVVTAVVFRYLAAPSEAAGALGQMRASAMYYANWAFVADAQDYFAADLDQSPVLHFWSLAVEEQFYILWPLALALVYRLTRPMGVRQWAAVRGVIVAAMAASAVGAAWVARTDLTRAYYGTDTRAYQLLAGALLAVSPGVVDVARRTLAPRAFDLMSGLCVLALVVVATPWFGVSAVTRGLVVTVITVVILVALEAGGAGWVKRALSLPPLVYLGRISYGTYLWHWIVIVALERELDLSTRGVAVATILVATGLASLSYQILEMPVRRGPALDQRRIQVIATGLALSLLLGTVVLPRLLTARGEQVVTVAPSTRGPSPRQASDVDWPFAKGDVQPFDDCARRGPAACTLVKGTGPKVLLLGDSHALALTPMMIELAEQRSLTLSVVTSPGCPWAVGLVDLDPDAEGCQDRRSRWYREIVPALDPDLVVLAQRPMTDPTNSIELSDVDRGRLPQGSRKLVEAVELRSRQTIEPLVEAGRDVLILEPIPVLPKGQDMTTCLAEATTTDECRFVTATAPSDVERIYRRLADEIDGVSTADLDRMVCPYLPICDPLAGRVVVFRDDIHLTRTFAASLAEPFGRCLTESGLLPP